MYLMGLITMVCSLQPAGSRTECLRRIDACVWHWERIDTKGDNVEQKVFTCYRELYGEGDGYGSIDCEDLLKGNPGYVKR